jgi:hypothetical protein
MPHPHAGGLQCTLATVPCLCLWWNAVYMLIGAIHGSLKYDGHTLGRRYYWRKTRRGWGGDDGVGRRYYAYRNVVRTFGICSILYQSQLYNLQSNPSYNCTAAPVHPSAIAPYPLKRTRTGSALYLIRSRTAAWPCICAKWPTTNSNTLHLIQRWKRSGDGTCGARRMQCYPERRRQTETDFLPVAPACRGPDGHARLCFQHAFASSRRNVT